MLYCLLTHDGPKQTGRLLRSIYNSGDEFIIHVDQAAGAAYRAFVAKATRGLPNIRVISTRTCSWGGFSLVYAMLDMLRIGLATDDRWRHAAILSATHLPLWPLERIRTLLPERKSALAWHGSLPSNDKWQKELKRRIEWDFEEKPGQRIQRGAYLGAPGFRYYKGPQWNILARHHVQHVVWRAKDEMFRRLSRSHIADEAFFQTMLLNSPLAKDCENIWTTAFVWKPIAGSPEILGYTGYRDALGDAKRPFIRKIAEDIAEEREMAALIEAATGNMPHRGLLENLECAG